MKLQVVSWVWLVFLELLLSTPTGCFTIPGGAHSSEGQQRVDPWCRRAIHHQDNHVWAEEDPSTIEQRLYPAFTSVLLQISYDGARFSGWSAGNDISTQSLANGTEVGTVAITGTKSTFTNNNNRNRQTHPPRSSRRRRNRHLYSADSNGVRSVEGVLRLALAKLYRNVSPIGRVVVEGASRTDKGVHAKGMVAQVYCLTEEAYMNATTSPQSPLNSVIPGKRLPHPRNGTDAEWCMPLPMPMDRLAFALNRMMPPDIRILRVAHLPTTSTSTTTTTPKAFHASQSATWKTYTYRLSTGTRADPTQSRTTWHTSVRSLDISVMQQVATSMLATGSAQDFSAFAGAPRGQDRKHRRHVSAQNPWCTLRCINLRQVHDEGDWHANDYRLYTITITGDRFLYKMVRFLVGTLVGIGKGDISVQHVQTMLQTGQRENIRIECAPAHGLVLEQVHYDNHAIDWQLASS